MNLMDLLGSDTGQGAVGEIARQMGIDEADAQRAIRQLLPALSRGIQRNAAEPGGLDALLEALANGNHERYVEQPQVLGQPDAVSDGNAILGHIFGSKDVSRNVAGRAAQETGLSSDLLRRMLPILATVAMGMLSKQTQGMRPVGAQRQSTGSPAFDILNQVLDTNQDGSVVDDLLNMARKFF